jgi:LPXTG-motif cell wall-anchored protein
LPVAGGAGTLWFTGGGLALAGAAALLYFKQRRNKGEE